MDFLDAIREGITAISELGGIPGQVQDERVLKLRENLFSMQQRFEAAAAEAEAKRQRQDLVTTERLAPGVDARDRTKRNDELIRTLQLQDAQTRSAGSLAQTVGGVQRGNIEATADGSVRGIDATYRGAQGLEVTRGDVDIKRMSHQNQAALQALAVQRAHETGMMDRFIGQTPLAEQVFGSAAQMQGNQHGLIRDLAQMAQPTGIGRALGYVNDLGRTAAALGIAFGRR